MLEKYMILTRGFRNIPNAEGATGFELQVRIPYYRGVWLALVSGFDLVVDQETYRSQDIRVRYKGQEYTAAELSAEESVHWDHGDPLTLLVPKPGGLTPGLHDLDLTIRLLPAFTTISGRSRRQITLVA